MSDANQNPIERKTWALCGLRWEPNGVKWNRTVKDNPATVTAATHWQRGKKHMGNKYSRGSAEGKKITGELFIYIHTSLDFFPPSLIPFGRLEPVFKMCVPGKPTTTTTPTPVCVRESVEKWNKKERLIPRKKRKKKKKKEYGRAAMPRCPAALSLTRGHSFSSPLCCSHTQT